MSYDISRSFLKRAAAMRNPAQPETNETDQSAGKSVVKTENRSADAMAKVAAPGDRLKKKRREEVERELDESRNPGGFAADMFTPMSAGGARAGLAATRGRAAGVTPAWGTRNPGKASLLNAMLGSVVGGIGGGVIGHAVGGKTPFTTPDGKQFDVPLAAVGGAGLGSALGAVSALLYTTLSRRRDMKRMERAYVDARSEGKAVEPERESYGKGAKLFSPLSGSWRQGESEAILNMRGKRNPREADEALNLSTGFDLGGRLVPPLSLAHTVYGWKQHQLADRALEG